MFERALVAMDLSPATEALVSSIPGLQQFGTRELVLAHVAPPIREPVSVSLDEARKLKQRLEALATRLRNEGFEVTVDVPSGSPVTELVRLAVKHGPDFILIGSRSHTRIHEAFVGSVAWDLVRSAPCPVLLQRIEANRPDPEAALEARAGGLPRRVLHPTDFSETAVRALPNLDALAKLHVEEIVLLHVLPADGAEGREEASHRLEALAAQLRFENGPIITPQVRLGTAWEEILAAGARNSDTMVVMGTQGRGFLPEIVMGSVSRQVVRQASAPVLLVPSSAGVETA